jgi:hypothetical protein
MFGVMIGVLTVERSASPRHGRNSAYELATGELGALRIGSRRMIVLKTALGKYLGLSNTGSAGTP